MSNSEWKKRVDGREDIYPPQPAPDQAGGRAGMSADYADFVQGTEEKIPPVVEVF